MANDIFIFGDSIAYGAFDREKGGWVNRLRFYLDNKTDGVFKADVYNLGISGDTTEDLLKRFDVGINRKAPGMIIFAIGINDSVYFSDKNKNYVEFDRFKDNIRTLIEKARKFTGNIVFIGLTPVVESETTPIPWEPEMHYLDGEIEKYNNAISELCQVEKIMFIDLKSGLLKLDYKALLDEDGLHPNPAGHEWIAKKIIKELKF